MRPICVIGVICGVLFFFPGFAAAQNTSKTVWTGVYSTAQAARGKTEYIRACSRCHASDLDGVHDANLLGDFAPRFSLRGSDFMERWREDTLQSLYTLIVSGMPPRNEPRDATAPLTESAYLDVVAYILESNGFPPGSVELGVPELRRIRIQEKDGPKPLPSFSMVQTVGCLTQYKPGVWQLSMATEPVRIRELTPPSGEGLRDAGGEPPGVREFDLQNMGYVGREFSAAAYEGHKMAARGILIWQPPSARIDIRSFVEVSPDCDR
jgi:cytochrome c5